MSSLWVFILDPKNFLALIGLGTIIYLTVKFVRWIYRPAPKPRVINLTKD